MLAQGNRMSGAFDRTPGTARILRSRVNRLNFGFVLFFLGLATGVGALAQTAPSAAAQDGPAGVRRLGALSREFKELARRVNPAVVRVAAVGYRQLEDDESEEPGVAARQRSTGSGVIIDANGYVVTNAHVVLGAKRVHVFVAGLQNSVPSRGPGAMAARRRSFRAEVVGLDIETDIALLKVDAKGLPALHLADSDAVEPGQWVMAFGSPLGLDNSVSMGVISSTSRQLRPEDPIVYLQTDASINPGNSGGPLVDIDGNIVGINTLIMSQSGGSEGLGFALPSNLVSSVVVQLRESGRVVRGQIGVYLQTISPALARGWKLPRNWGVVISDVDQDGAAEKAGLQIGDVVQSLNGKPIETARQFGAALMHPAPGAKAHLEVLRGTQTVQVDVAVHERNDDARNYAETGSREENLIAEIGIFALDLSPAMRDQLEPLRQDQGGVLVAAREADGPALGENFESGDVLYSLNHESVKDVKSLRAILKRLRPGDAVAAQVERQGKLRFVSFEMP